MRLLKLQKKNTKLIQNLQHPFKTDKICTQNYINTQFKKLKIVIYF